MEEDWEALLKRMLKDIQETKARLLAAGYSLKELGFEEKIDD